VHWRRRTHSCLIIISSLTHSDNDTSCIKCIQINTKHWLHCTTCCCPACYSKQLISAACHCCWLVVQWQCNIVIINCHCQSLNVAPHITQYQPQTAFSPVLSTADSSANLNDDCIIYCCAWLVDMPLNSSILSSLVSICNYIMSECKHHFLITLTNWIMQSLETGHPILIVHWQVTCPGISLNDLFTPAEV